MDNLAQRLETVAVFISSFLQAQWAWSIDLLVSLETVMLSPLTFLRPAVLIIIFTQLPTVSSTAWWRLFLVKYVLSSPNVASRIDADWWVLWTPDATWSTELIYLFSSDPCPAQRPRTFQAISQSSLWCRQSTVVVVLLLISSRRVCYRKCGCRVFQALTMWSKYLRWLALTTTVWSTYNWICSLVPCSPPPHYSCLMYALLKGWCECTSFTVLRRNAVKDGFHRERSSSSSSSFIVRFPCYA